jgi:predicted nucleic-acid-binding protein
MKRTIITSDEFVYDVLNNMVHHNEIIISRKDLAKSRALKHIVSRVSDTFTMEENLDYITLKKIKKLDANIKFLKKPAY